MPTVNAPVFVMGTPRSGTTLTANIIGRHADVFMPGENHFFEYMYSRNAEYGDLSNAENREKAVKDLLGIYGHFNQVDDQPRVDALFQNSEKLERLKQGEDLISLLSEFMQIQAEAEGKPRWGNNTPKDIFHIQEIMRAYPDAKIFVCVRDARDFAFSYKKRWQVTTDAHQSRLKDLYHPVITALLWKATMKRIETVKRLVPEGQYMVVKYESLVTDPESTVKAICQTAGLNYSDDLLQVATHNSSKAGQQKGIFSSSVASWKKKYEPDEAQVVQRVAKNELLKLGYELERFDCSLLQELKHYLGAPRGLYKAMAANSAHRGALLPYVMRRMKSIVSAG